MKFSLFTHDNATGLKTSFDEAGGTQAHTAVRILRHCRPTVGKRDAQGTIQSRSWSVLSRNSPRCKLVLQNCGNPRQRSHKLPYFTFSFLSDYRPTYHSAYVCLPVHWPQAVSIRERKWRPSLCTHIFLIFMRQYIGLKLATNWHRHASANRERSALKLCKDHNMY